VRASSRNLNQVSVSGSELAQGQLVALQRVETLRRSETIELLLLVANSVVLHDDGAGKVTEKVKLEPASLHGHIGVEVLRVHGLTLVKGLLVMVHVVHEGSHVTLANLVDLLLEDLGISGDSGAVAGVGSDEGVAEHCVLLEVSLHTEVALADLLMELLRHVTFRHHDPGAGANELLEHISRGSVLAALGNNQVLDGLVASVQGEDIVDGVIVVGANAIETFVKEALVDFLLGFGNLLERSVKLIHHLEETSGDSLFELSAFVVQQGKFARLGLGLD
jgi:hypothetical protein